MMDDDGSTSTSVTINSKAKKMCATQTQDIKTEQYVLRYLTFSYLTIGV